MHPPALSAAPTPPDAGADDLRYWEAHLLVGTDPHDAAHALNRTAARTLRLMGWLASLGVAVTGVAVIMPTLATPSDDYPLDLLLVMAQAAAIAALLFTVARGLLVGRRWARAAGIVCGLAACLAIPVGTVAGGHVLWRLARHWESPRTPGVP